MICLVFLSVKLSSCQRRYLQQQQADGQTGHQQQVVFSPPDDFLQAANGEDVLTGRRLLQLLHPITTHSVQHSLQVEITCKVRKGKIYMNFALDIYVQQRVYFNDL